MRLAIFKLSDGGSIGLPPEGLIVRRHPEDDAVTVGPFAVTETFAEAVAEANAALNGIESAAEEPDWDTVCNYFGQDEGGFFEIIDSDAKPWSFHSHDFRRENRTSIKPDAKSTLIEQYKRETRHP